jgi:hypothetical protein
VDQATRRHFYVNSSTLESTWTRPSAATTPVVSKLAAVTAAVINQRRPAPTTALPPLPAGWEEHVDPSTQRHFYVHSHTHESTWMRPSIATPVAPAPTPTTATAPTPTPTATTAPTAVQAVHPPLLSSLSALPSGWLEQVVPFLVTFFSQICFFSS